MIKHIAPFFFLFLLSQRALADCQTVVPGYESNDVMYVLCKNLNISTNAEATNIVQAVFNQYKGPPDEILVYFVSVQSAVGKSKFIPSELSGVYYTHDNILTVWPEIPEQKKEFKILWK